MMWEKELIAKFRNKYIINWATNATTYLNALRVEKREDDVHLTPKGKEKAFDHPNITKFGYYNKNIDSLM